MSKGIIDDVLKSYSDLFGTLTAISTGSEQVWQKLKADTKENVDIFRKYFCPMMWLMMTLIVVSVFTDHFILENDAQEGPGFFEEALTKLLMTSLTYFVGYLINVNLFEGEKVKAYLGLKEEKASLVVFYPYCMMILACLIEMLASMLFILKYVMIVMTLMAMWNGVTVLVADIELDKKRICVFLTCVMPFVLNLCVTSILSKMMM